MYHPGSHRGAVTGVSGGYSFVAIVSSSPGYTFENMAAETLGISRRECYWSSECSRLAKQAPRLDGFDIYSRHESFCEINSLLRFTYKFCLSTPLSQDG